jgi:hypothetical protein
MTFEEFLKRLEKEDVCIYMNNRPCIKCEWVVGGSSGGSCWGHSSNDAVPPEPEPDFMDFDLILTIFAPELPYLKYKKLSNEIIKRDTRTNTGYYGNYTDYATKTVDLENLYTELIRMGVIS